MKLDVIPTSAGPDRKQPWYADGLDFTCTQCGNCCTGGPGYVWVTKDEIVRLADHLGITPEECVERYCRKVEGKVSLKERRTPEGNYDCIFLGEETACRSGGGGSSPGEVRRTCAVYDVRPLQCRTWPFWADNLSSKAAWDRAGTRCHGINQGRHFSINEIHSVRDAAEWPKDPPSSDR